MPPDSSDSNLVTPELTERQKEEAADRTSVSAVVVHEAIRNDGEEELNRPASALAYSAFAAGMSMGFSFVGEALLSTYLPNGPWKSLIVPLGYPIGFLIVILGRQQLFTENTLTAIIPLLTRRSLGSLVQVLRLWGIVLASNLVGAHLFAWIAGNTPMFEPAVKASMLALAQHSMHVTFGQAVLRGIFAGWLIAMVVWILAAVDSDRVVIISILTYTVGLAGLTHIIAGSVEVLFLPMVGAASWSTVVVGYMLPTLLGNVIGGTSLTAAINHAQVVSGMGIKGNPSED